MILKTKRLELRKLEESDNAFIFELLNEPSWIRFIGNKKVHSLEDATCYIVDGPQKSYEKNGFGLYAVTLAGETIGISGLIKRDSLPDVDIGFAFLERHVGHGYATESAHAVMEHGLQKLHLKRIVAITALDNERSIHVLQKIGLKLRQKIQLPEHEGESLLFVSS